MLGFYNYTVILTYLGMLFGFYGIGSAMDGDVSRALLCLMAAGFCDMFDGKVASTMERTTQQKQFGIQIDSLADLICFGVLPGVIVYRISGFGLWLSGLYALCALIRLAWFNVDEQQRQEKTADSRTMYQGLPVTTAALIFPFMMAISRTLNLSAKLLAPVVLALTGVAFLTPFSLRKPQKAGKVGIMVCGAAVLALLLVRRR